MATGNKVSEMIGVTGESGLNYNPVCFCDYGLRRSRRDRPAFH